MKLNIQCLLGGMLLGVVVFDSLSAKEPGQTPKIGKNILIYLGNGKCIHIHHWTILLTLLIMLIIIFRLSDCTESPWVYLIAGFLIGGILQDFKYGKSVFKFKQKCNK